MNRLCCLLLLLVFAATVHAGWKTRNKNKKTTPSTDNTSVDGAEPELNGSVFDSIYKANIKSILKEDDSAFSIGDFDGGKPHKLFEGDIVETPQLKKYILKKKTNPDSEDSPLDAITNGAWPNGVVPYTFASGFSYTNVVYQAIAEYKKKTCIRFRPKRRSDTNYVEFMHGGGCYSMIGRQGRRQQISLGQGCGYKGTTIHEMMHALGFYHEQSRRDRDGYIRIVWANIRRAMWYNFEKYKLGRASTLGEPYDKASVMHYGNYAFSTNGRKTIISKANPNEQFGRKQALSRVDVRQLNKYYKCGGIKTTKKPSVRTTKKPTTTKACSDKYGLCTTMATNGLCSNSWVKSVCKKSCKHSSCKPKVNCVNKSKHCVSWSRKNKHCPGNGGCCKSGSYVSYMKNNCKKACALC